MASFNKVILVGNLTRDPEKRFTGSGVAVTNFSLAVNRKYKQGDQDREETLFIDIVTWARQAEICAEYLSKGRPVLVEGRLVQRKWETDDGQRRSKIEVTAETVQFLGSREGGGGGGRPSGGGGSDEDYTPTDDDIPF